MKTIPDQILSPNIEPNIGPNGKPNIEPNIKPKIERNVGSKNLFYPKKLLSKIFCLDFFDQTFLELSCLNKKKQQQKQQPQP